MKLRAPFLTCRFAEGHRRHWLEAVLIAGLFFLLYQMIWDCTVYNIYQARDLRRAAEFAQGHFLFFGPETSGGGHTPGSFYYLLLAVPFALGAGAKGAWWLMLLLMSSGLAGAWLFFRRRRGLAASVVVVLYLYWCLELLSELCTFWNPSYLPLFALLVIFGLCHCFGEDGRWRSPIWYGTCFLMGLCIQIHYSAVVLPLATCALLLFTKTFDLFRFSRRHVLIGAICFSSTLAPFLLDRVLHESPASHLTLQWQGLRLTLEHFIDSGYFDKIEWGGIFKRALVYFDWRVIVATFIFVPAISRFKPKTPDQAPEKKSDRRLQSVLAIILAISFLPALYSILMPYCDRYSELAALTFPLFATSFAFNKLKDHRQRAFFLLVVTALFSTRLFNVETWNFLTASLVLKTNALALILMVGVGLSLALSQRHRIRGLEIGLSFLIIFNLLGRFSPAVFKDRGFVTDYLTDFADLREMAEAVYSQTGWGEAEARRRLFYIHIQHEMAQDLIYNEVAKAGPPPASPAPSIDGFFVVRLGPEALDELKEPQKFLEWLRRLSLEPSILEALKTNRLSLGQPEFKTRSVLIPYFVPDKFKFPAFFQNSGRPYERGSADEDLLKLSNGRTEARQLGSKIFLFSWSPCASAAIDCSSGAVVKIIDRDDKHIRLHVSLVGDAISTPSQWTRPEWTHVFKHPRLTVTCRGQAASEVLAEFVGLRPDHYIIESQSLIAPFDRDLKLPCEGNLESLAFDWQDSVGFRFFNFVQIPGQTLTVEVSR